MPTQSRALTNSYQDCQLVKLDPDDPASPLVVTQEGYAPSDPACRVRLFYLQRNGFWIDEVGRSPRPESETGDIVFESASEAVQTLSRLFGKPLIREVPVTEADVQNYMANARGGSSKELLKRFLSRYRASKPRP